MATKVGIIAEGPIDEALLPVLLDGIARNRANCNWPIIPGDIGNIIPYRKRGHGGVLDSVRRIVEHLSTFFLTPEHAFYDILLDRRTTIVQSEVRKLIGGNPLFVMGIAIEEIEAWWLSDKRKLFQFFGLTHQDCIQTRYGAPKYKAESDDNPKRTLHELTEISPARSDTYGSGNAMIARDFAEDYWMGRVDLDALEQQCPKGYKPFSNDVVYALRREMARQTPPV